MRIIPLTFLVEKLVACYVKNAAKALAKDLLSLNM